jgi:methylated-DNA-[protein]-cysteine S-methyltransferase
VVARSSVSTSIGRIELEATVRGIRRVHLPSSATEPAEGDGETAARAHLATAAEQIAEYARGEREAFLLDLDWEEVDPVHRRVLETLREIAPYGATVTYGELGRAAGVDDPRDVGSYMARNPFPIVVPCHRVVASDGLGGYGGGLELKTTLLELEGVLPARLELGV